jgi:hypothetical protein
LILQGDTETASTYFIRSFELFLELDTKYDALWCLSNIAMFESDTKHYARALQLAGVVEEQTRVLGISFPDYHLGSIHRAIETSTRAVGESEAAVLQDKGRKLSLAKVLALVNVQPTTMNDKVLAPTNV